MMRNKKKRFGVLCGGINDTSYKRPRSSLKVNLSCASNLTDSGHDSLDFDANNTISHGIPLKNVSIILERVDANQENELVDSTSSASKIKRNLPSNDALKTRLSTKIADIDVTKCNDRKNDKSQNICNTPKITYRNKELKRMNGLGILTEIQSHDLEERSDVCSKNVNLESRVSKELVRLRSRTSNDKNAMSMGMPCSSKKTNIDELDSSIICRNRFSQSSVSSISESVFAEIPIGCSTMIDDNVSDEESNKHQEDLACVSVQEVSRNDFRSNRSVQVPRQANNELVARSACDEEAVVIGTDSINTVRTSLNVNTSVDAINSKNSSKRKRKDSESHGSEDKQRNRRSTASSLVRESTNTVRTSLQVNMSYTSNQLQNSNNIGTTRISTTESIKILDICDANDTGKNGSDDRKINSPERPNQGGVVIPERVDENGTSTSSSIVDESPDKIQTERKENIRNSKTVPNAKKGKRKLLPLRECSQLVSFTPIQNECPLPRPLIFGKRFRKKKNNTYNKSNSGGIEVRSMRKEEKNHGKEEKTQKKPRKVISKKIVVKKIADEGILRKLTENTENCNKPRTANVCVSNGSVDDFQSRKISKKNRTQRLYIVTTGLSNEDKSLVKSVVQTLGSAKIEPSVTKNTTHVVTTGVRTINLLHGIIRGCWLVGLEWVLKSLESKEWLIPVDYEMAHFSKAVSENRKDRQLFGKSYVPELFTACGPICVEKTTKLPLDALIDLVKAAGGCITKNPETAKILIGPGGLKETWILDCITTGELQSCNHYRHSMV